MGFETSDLKPASPKPEVTAPVDNCQRPDTRINYGQQDQINTAQLEAQKVLPKIELTAKKEWTLAVALSATLPGDDRKPLGSGTENQLAQLKTMAKETEGHSVAFMVHAERTLGANGKPCLNGKSGHSEKDGACVEAAADKHRAITERYFIHDGKVEKMPDVKYKTGADDLKALLQETGQKAPSEKVGLIIQSHGDGTGGIEMTKGHLSLDKTIDTIKAGLKGSGHEKLDILDYDSCVMGAAGVLGKTAAITKDVVASSAEEGSNEDHDGQNLQTAVQALMANPQMTGREWGEKIVEQAKTGVNGEGEKNTVITLANFDISKHEDFVKGLDAFGAALQEVAGDPKNMKIIHQDVDLTDIPKSGLPNSVSQDRDLKSFAQNILDDIRSQRLNGDTKKLESSTNAFIDSINKYATAQYGDMQAGDGDSAGLTAPIPGQEIFNKNNIEREISPLFQSNSKFKDQFKYMETFKDKDTVSQGVAAGVNHLLKNWAGKHPHEMDKIVASADKILAAKNFEELKENTKRLVETVTKIDNGPVGEQTRASMRPLAEKLQHHIQNAKPDLITPGWDNFVAQVKTSGFKQGR